MSGARDPYKVLQVDPEADPEVIQAAYRRLAQKYHPDLVGAAGTSEGVDSDGRMVVLNAAWEILRDPVRRAAHDQARRDAVASSPPPSAPARAPEGSPSAPATAHAPAARRAAEPSFERGQVTFGRYAGWRIDEIFRVDPGYLEWLDRTPAGRPYRDDIDAVLRKVGRRSRGTEGTAGLRRR